MNRVISWLQNVFVNVILSLSLVSFAFLLNVAVGFDNSSQAQAKPLTPEATQYEVDGEDNPFKAEQDAGKENLQDTANRFFAETKKPQDAPEITKEIGENLNKPARETQQKAEGVLETIKEKLNLDQPIYPGTKEFVNDVQDNIQETAKGAKQAVDNIAP